MDGIELVEDFLNTLDVNGGTDALAGGEELDSWLGVHGLSATPAQLRRAREVRRALRVSLGEGVGPRRSEAPVPVRVEVGPEGAQLVPAGDGLDAHVARVLSAVLRLTATGDWERVKACALSSCRWVFYDRSKNRSARWCSMAGCGTRAKTAAYRARHR